MKIDLTRHVPLGWNYKIQTQIFGYGMAIAALISFFSFLAALDEALDDLYIPSHPFYQLIPGAVMPDYADLLGLSLIGFYVLAFSMAAFLVFHYAYHYQGSKSIYLMRRLPSRWELHRRCLTLPVLAAALCLICALLLLHIYLVIYLLVTPKACLTPNQWLKIWSVIP